MELLSNLRAIGKICTSHNVRMAFAFGIRMDTNRPRDLVRHVNALDFPPGTFRPLLHLKRKKDGSF